MKTAGPKGLTELKTEELKRLLGHVHRGELKFPLSAEHIACVGFQYRQAEILSAMRSLNAAGARAVLVCVLAERISQEPQ